jgi:hypothetical protein
MLEVWFGFSLVASLVLTMGIMREYFIRGRVRFTVGRLVVYLLFFPGSLVVILTCVITYLLAWYTLEGIWWLWCRFGSWFERVIWEVERDV